ncbi:hypothetical protein KCU78_g87, partial [Aureobasidium melanogenum]
MQISRRILHVIVATRDIAAYNENHDLSRCSASFQETSASDTPGLTHEEVIHLLHFRLGGSVNHFHSSCSQCNEVMQN